MPGTMQPNVVAMAGFAIFIGLSLVITWFAARRTHSTEHSTPRADRSRPSRTGWRSPATT